MEALESVSNSRPLGGEIRAKSRGDVIIVNLPLLFLECTGALNYC